MKQRDAWALYCEAYHALFQGEQHSVPVLSPAALQEMVDRLAPSSAGTSITLEKWLSYQPWVELVVNGERLYTASTVEAAWRHGVPVVSSARTSIMDLTVRQAIINWNRSHVEPGRPFPPLNIDQHQEGKLADAVLAAINAISDRDVDRG